jgi:hypothetical protein
VLNSCSLSGSLQDQAFSKSLVAFTFVFKLVYLVFKYISVPLYSSTPADASFVRLARLLWKCLEQATCQDFQFCSQQCKISLQSIIIVRCCSDSTSVTHKKYSRSKQTRVTCHGHGRYPSLVPRNDTHNANTGGRIDMRNVCKHGILYASDCRDELDSNRRTKLHV